MLSGPAASNREGARLGTWAWALVPVKSAFTHLLFTLIQYQLYSARTISMPTSFCASTVRAFYPFLLPPCHQHPTP